MRSRLRLRVLVPAAAALAVAVSGLALFQLGVGPLGLGSDEEASVAAGAVASSGGAATAPEEAESSAAGSTDTSPGSAPVDPEAPQDEVAPTDSGEAATAGSGTATGMDSLVAQLESHRVVVLVTYIPDAHLDGEVTRAARLAAEDVSVGFVSVNAVEEKQIEELALLYDLRDTPAVLVFRRGPELKTKLVGWADRETIAQAAQNAKRVA